MIRYTHKFGVWENDESGSIYGNLSTGGNGHGLAHVDLADSSQGMSLPDWDQQTWERLQISFDYADKL